VEGGDGLLVGGKAGENTYINGGEKKEKNRHTGPSTLFLSLNLLHLVVCPSSDDP
jgi:hypothetical protein